MVPCILIILVI